MVTTKKAKNKALNRTLTYTGTLEGVCTSLNNALPEEKVVLYGWKQVLPIFIF
jgi:hypothetical protein